MADSCLLFFLCLLSSPPPLLHILVVLPGTKPSTLLRLILDLQIDDDDGDENDDIPKFISSFNTVL